MFILKTKLFIGQSTSLSHLLSINLFCYFYNFIHFYYLNYSLQTLEVSSIRKSASRQPSNWTAPGTFPSFGGYIIVKEKPINKIV
jgi:hypothetical protein